ncbi:14629_t:CDS:2, partial [Acaulospora colombiana]
FLVYFGDVADLVVQEQTPDGELLRERSKPCAPRLHSSYDDCRPARSVFAAYG